MNPIDNDLWIAIHNKDLETANKLLEQGANLESKDTKGKTILRCYGTDIHYKNVNEWMINKGADINSRDDYGDGIIHDVIRNSDLKSFDWLMSQNIDVNLTNDQGSTPLLAACAINKMEFFDDLLLKGANPNIASKWGNTPLFTAAGRGQYEMVAKLLEHGADPSFIDKDGKTVIHEARPVEFRMGVEDDFKSNIYKIINLLLDKHVEVIDLNKKTNFNTSILVNAVNNEELMLKMIEAGTNPNVRFDSYLGLTPLHIACKSGNLPLIDSILNNGFDFSVKDDEGRTAPALILSFMLTTIKETKQKANEVINNIQQQMMSAMEDPDLSDDEKDEIKKEVEETVKSIEEEIKESIQAEKDKMLTILDMFIQHGLDVNELYDEKQGLHFMHLPVLANDIEMAEKLLDLGFPIDPPMALHKKVSEYNHKTDSDIKTFLEEIDRIVPSPLLFSVNKLNADFVDFFIKNGADINAKDFYGNNALYQAIQTEEDIKILRASQFMRKQATQMTAQQRMESSETYSKQMKEISSELMTKRIAVLDKLVDNGVQINNENDDGATVLMLAAKGNALDFVGIMAKRYNADILYKNENEDTALSVALTSGNSLLFRELVEVVRQQGRFEETNDVLTQAILTSPDDYNARHKFLKSLASVGNDPLWLNNKEGAIPLIAAIENNEHDVVKVLIEAGADVKIKDENGNTPLIYAVINKDKQSVLLLRSAGADVNEANNKGVSPISLSRSSDYAEVRIAMNAFDPNILDNRTLSFGLDASLSQEDVWDHIPTRKGSKLSM